MTKLRFIKKGLRSQPSSGDEPASAFPHGAQVEAFDGFGELIGQGEVTSHVAEHAVIVHINGTPHRVHTSLIRRLA